MSRWVNWWWRAIEMSPDDHQMNPGETRRLLAESQAASQIIIKTAIRKNV